MNWQEGQRVECDGLDWGPCYVTMSSQHMVVVYCPRYELVTTASPAQLEKAGWRLVQRNNVVWMKDWSKGNRPTLHPLPTS